MKHGQCARCVELAAEIARLTPYVEAFRREEARADKLAQELDDLRAAQGAPDSAEESTAVYLKGYAAGLNDGALTVRPAQCALWRDGAPAKPWSTEWFIAETTFGERIVLRELPDEWTYDFKTADETHFKRDLIKRWMQFPDSQFIAPGDSAVTPADGGGK